MDIGLKSRILRCMSLWLSKKQYLEDLLTSATCVFFPQLFIIYTQNNTSSLYLYQFTATCCFQSYR